MAFSRVVLLAVVAGVGIFYADAFCRRPYDFPDWEAKSLAERAQAVDIVVYGNVTLSPCTKPPPSEAPSTVQPATSESVTNASMVNSTAAPNITTPRPTTTAPTVSRNSSFQNISSSPSHNCSTGYYNITVQVYCVIKGGHLPEFLQLERFGLGDEMCVHPNETVEQFHAYEGVNYVFFLGRHEVVRNGSNGFWLHTVNEQPAAAEISEESLLEHIFEAAGKHAHIPLGIWANQTHDICKPYTESTGPGPISAHVTIVSLATLVSMVFYAQ